MQRVTGRAKTKAPTAIAPATVQAAATTDVKHGAGLGWLAAVAIGVAALGFTLSCSVAAPKA